MNTPVFIISYLFLMVFTYIWRFAAFGSLVSSEAQEASSTATAMHVLMFINYLLLVFIAFLRGKRTGKAYIAAFPFVGGLFDIVLVFIPFVPTVMNIITIVLGSPEGEKNKNA